MIIATNKKQPIAVFEPAATERIPKQHKVRDRQSARAPQARLFLSLPGALGLLADRLLAEVLASCRAVWIAQDSLAVGREQQFANPKNQVSSQVLDGSCPPEPIQFDFTMVKDRIRP